MLVALLVCEIRAVMKVANSEVVWNTRGLLHMYDRNIPRNTQNSSLQRRKCPADPKKVPFS